MKIAVGYDGSKVAEEAIKFARDRARVFKAKVYLISSLKGGSQFSRKEFEDAEQEMNRVNQYFTKEGIPSEKRLLVRGLSPGEDIVNFSKENKVDEIIIGVRRRSRVGKALFGSTAQYVILNSHCPVVTIK
jgi:nucleotide-binding universal stress UspA family protein